MKISTIERIAEALASSNPDQKMIAEVGCSWLTTLLNKNHDYGSSAFQVPVLAPKLPATSAILVRMSDKIARINNILQNDMTPQVQESLEDTISDLSSYGVLYLIAKEYEKASNKQT